MRRTGLLITARGITHRGWGDGREPIQLGLRMGQICMPMEEIILSYWSIPTACSQRQGLHLEYSLLHPHRPRYQKRGSTRKRYLQRASSTLLGSRL
jgi:hypothetical protein